MQRIHCKAFDVTLLREDNDTTVLICHKISPEFLGRLRFRGRYYNIESITNTELREDYIFLKGQNDHHVMNPSSRWIESPTRYWNRIADLQMAAEHFGKLKTKSHLPKWW